MPNNLSAEAAANDFAMSDEELDRVSGGVNYVFRGESFQRDSWFVSFLTRQLIQSSLRQGLSAPLNETPQAISVQGRKYQVWQQGETVYVEEAL